MSQIVGSCSSLLSYQKTGNFCDFFLEFCKVPSSTYNKIKPKAYIYILKQASPQIDFSNMYRKYQAFKKNIKRDIIVQKILLKNMYFLIIIMD